MWCRGECCSKCTINQLSMDELKEFSLIGNMHGGWEESEEITCLMRRRCLVGECLQSYSYHAENG